ncbi:MAG: DEAD/DEAH box helicase [Verrucomicrobia bacterium]|jgi:ATP-dependent RNA helicase RhlE|nr:DEAD/DEAH box helicase [Verrucomicrobiota bacterium]MBT7067603.1 DEAD/DEAH box helicase [Verrucomicrobiota bacterium]MBT7700722.1 DEAD/DEAH box helicase [Verrucomicrobiota bacterium]
MNEKKQGRCASTAPQAPLSRQPLEGVFGALNTHIQRAVASEGYVTPTPIQEQCIPHLLEGRDILGSAQTGTGKTAAFALPLLQRLDATSRRPSAGTPRALILAPTRELAAQIGESIGTYGRHLRISHTVIFGGVNQFHQVKVLNRGVDILVATPGRLLDLMQQGLIHLGEVEVFVLDEVDRMLDMGFIPDIKRVLSKIPVKRQTLFFSATLPPKMVQLAQTMVRNPVMVTIEPDKPAVERIDQKVLFVGKKDKDALLVSLLNEQSISKALIFTQMKHIANRVTERLGKEGISGAAIHGNKSQSARTRALDGFKSGRFKVLVATDVAARGLDVDDITHVINYDLPMEAETYVHRIGRTARAGAGGDAISFCCSEERAYLRDIEKLLGQQVPAEMEHAYHSDEAFRSTQPAPTNFGRGQGGGPRRSGRPGGKRNRPQGSRQGQQRRRR